MKKSKYTCTVVLAPAESLKFESNPDPHVEPPHFTPEDDAAMDRAWKTIAEKKARGEFPPVPPPPPGGIKLRRRKQNNPPEQ